MAAPVTQASGGFKFDILLAMKYSQKLGHTFPPLRWQVHEYFVCIGIRSENNPSIGAQLVTSDRFGAVNLCSRVGGSIIDADVGRKLNWARPKLQTTRNAKIRVYKIGESPMVSLGVLSKTSNGWLPIFRQPLCFHLATRLRAPHEESRQRRRGPTPRAAADSTPARLKAESHG